MQYITGRAGSSKSINFPSERVSQNPLMQTGSPSSFPYFYLDTEPSLLRSTGIADAPRRRVSRLCNSWWAIIAWRSGYTMNPLRVSSERRVRSRRVVLKRDIARNNSLFWTNQCRIKVLELWDFALDLQDLYTVLMTLYRSCSHFSTHGLGRSPISLIREQLTPLFTGRKQINVPYMSEYVI